MTPFSLRANRDDDTTVLTIAGELDIATVPALRRAAYAELDEPDCKTLVFDLSDLAFLDSTGIGSWVEIRERALREGKRLVIRDTPPFVRRVLQIGALDSLFDES